MKTTSVVAKLQQINKELREETGVSKKAIKRGLKRLHPVTPRNKIGRNEPCPCGCGRKFKNHGK